MSSLLLYYSISFFSMRVAKQPTAVNGPDERLRRHWQRPSVSLLGRQGGGCRRFPFKEMALAIMRKRRIASTAGVCTLCDFRLGKQGTAVPTLHCLPICQNILGKQCTCGHTSCFLQIQRCCLLQKLVGEHPKPFNDFLKIGYAPTELNVSLSWKVN